MPRLLDTISAALLVITAGISFAQDTKAPGRSPTQEVRKLLTEVEDSFSRGDAKGLAACWTVNGDFTGPAGERAEGRQNIEKAFGEFFATRKDCRLKLRLTSFRVASDGLALLDTISEVQPAGTAGAGETSLSLVLVKRDNRWLIESARESAAPAPPPVQHLRDLEWMVGDWADERSPADSVSVRSTCDWTANRAFLIRKFKVEGKGDVSRAGTEIIGWDPRAQRIRSWAFDSDGGFGESVWVRDGNRWLVRYSGIRPDGNEASATNLLTVVDANTVRLQSRDRTANGERRPDVAEITIKRQVVAKDASKTESKKKPPERILP